MDQLLKAAPLPVVSVLIESVDGDGRCSPVCASPDFDAAEDALARLAAKESSRWPGGVMPVRVRVTFPRRLVFSYEFQCDESGLMEIHEAAPRGVRQGRRSTVVTLRERLVEAMNEALLSNVTSVEALAAKRVARIVLAYGNPAPMGR